MLTGFAPFEETTSATWSWPCGLTRSTEISLLPASTASRYRPSALCCSEPCDATPCPVPAPPIANGEPEMGVSDPSA